MNKIIGVLILILYFGNYHLSLLLANGDNDLYWDINKCIYSIIFILALRYKFEKTFIESLFIAIIVNNIYLLLYKKEISYSINDAYFIIWFTIIQNFKKNVSIFARIYHIFTHRIMGSDSSNNKKKE